MVDLYPYTKAECQKGAFPYPFVEYVGNDFLQAFLQERTIALERFYNSKESGMPGSSAPERGGNLKKLPEGLTTLAEVLDNIEKGNQPLLKILRRKAELRRLSNAYDEKTMRNYDLVDASAALYCRLANALSDHYQSTGSLQSLSTLLKVNDAIISKAEELSESEAGIATIAIKNELSSLQQLYSRLNANHLTERLSPSRVQA